MCKHCDPKREEVVLTQHIVESQDKERDTKTYEVKRLKNCFSMYVGQILSYKYVHNTLQHIRGLEVVIE